MIEAMEDRRSAPLRRAGSADRLLLMAPDRPGRGRVRSFFMLDALSLTKEGPVAGRQSPPDGVLCLRAQVVQEEERITYGHEQPVFCRRALDGPRAGRERHLDSPGHLRRPGR